MTYGMGGGGDIHAEDCGWRKTLRGCLWIPEHMLPSGGKTTTFKLACHAAQGCLELCSAAATCVRPKHKLAPFF